MLLHTCDLEVLERGEAVGALVRAREAGKIRFAGYSGDNQAGAYAARLDDVAVIQTPNNLCDHVHIHSVFPVAAACGAGSSNKVWPKHRRSTSGIRRCSTA